MTHDAITTLDGWWSFAPLRDAPTDAAAPPSQWLADAERIRVPGYWNHFPAGVGGDWGAYDHYRYPAAWQEAVAGWYRTTFAPATPPTGGRAALRCGAIAGHATVWLNGRRLGESFDNFLPLEFDVTDVLRGGGENELWVLVRPPQQQDGRWLQPPGSWVGWTLRGIWQSVELALLPAATIDDVFAQPSVRSDRLSVDVTVSQSDGGAHELALAVHDGDAVVLDLGRQTVEAAGVVRFEQERPGLKHWSPDNPQLYTLRATLLDARGNAVHARDVRFGFREFWIEGNTFRLNGDPIRLLGDSWHYMGVAQQNPAYARKWFELARATGIRAIRTHAMPYPPCYFDIADEMGMLIVAESAIYGSAGTLGYDSADFWQRSRDHMRRMVLRDRNHPSIIMWSATNETVWAAGDRIFPELAALRTEAERVDPTRVVSYDENDSDIGGASPVHAGHYGTVGHWTAVWPRERPLLMHEFGALYHGGPDDAAPTGGDAVYADYLARLRATGEDTASMFMGLRRLGAASITPWNVNWYCLEPLAGTAEDVPAELTAGGPTFDRIGERALTLNYGYLPDQPSWRPNPAYAPVAECYRAQCADVPHASRQGFGGTAYACDVLVFNDISDSATLRVRLELGTASAEQTIELAALASDALQLTLTLPPVTQATTEQATLRLCCAKSGSVLHEQAWDVHVHPRSGLSPTPRDVWLAGATNAAPSGWQTLTNARPTRDVLTKTNATVVLADGGAVRDWLDDDAVRTWIEAGGRLVALPDALSDADTSQLAPMRRSVTRVFPRAGELLSGLTADHFRDWPGPDHAVATAVMQRPDTGPALAAIDTGNAASGLAWTPLVIVPLGRGHVVLSGMPLLQRAADTPAAEILLQRLTQAELPNVAARPAAVLSDGDAHKQLADEVGLVRGGDADVLLVDGAEPAAAERPEVAPAALDALLAAGGTLVVNELTPETAAAWSQRLGLTFEITADERYNVARATSDPLLAGLNNYDLCWVDRDNKQPITRHTLTLPQDASARVLVQTVATRWEDYQMAAEQHKVAMMYRRLDAFEGPRAAVVAIRRGGGLILINQLLLHEARGAFRRKARRILSRWLDAAGAQRDPETNPLFVSQQRSTTAQGYIVDWLVAGPFGEEAGHPLDHPYLDEAVLSPTEGDAAPTGAWQRRTAAFAETDLSWMPVDAGADRVAYAVTYLYSPRDRSVLLDAPDMVTLLTGADGGVKAWLNGEPQGRFDFVRELVLDNDRVEGLPLRRGWNVLTLKLHKRGGGRWAFAARLLTSAGEPVTDVQVQAERPAELA